MANRSRVLSFAAHVEGEQGPHDLIASFHRHTARIALGLGRDGQITVEAYAHPSAAGHVFGSQHPKAPRHTIGRGYGTSKTAAPSGAMTPGQRRSPSPTRRSVPAYIVLQSLERHQGRLLKGRLPPDATAT